MRCRARPATVAAAPTPVPIQQRQLSFKHTLRPYTVCQESSQCMSETGKPAYAMPSCLALVQADSSSADLHPVLQHARACNCNRVYVATTGGPDATITQQLLDWLCELYHATALVDPRLDVVPCLACAGWNADRFTTLTNVQYLLAPTTLQQQADLLQQQLNSSRQLDATAIQLQLISPAEAGPREADKSTSQQQQPGWQKQQHEPHQDQQLLFDNVAVGGTFDRLHAGHRLLLAATALVCKQQVYIGITADNLLAKKANKQLLQDYEARRAAAVDFMVLVRPALVVQAGALSDPQEPTQAELDLSMQALVVSQETVTGGEAINKGRQQRGFAPLQLVVVGLIGGDAGSKLSSTALREADAAAGHQQLR